MFARCILSAKSSSFQFDDRVLILNTPIKIGRTHKDEKGETDNGYFDSKVLSRGHAVISYENSRFYIQDLGSSNGTFINNIRLNRSGEESKQTEIYSGDILRFGSDVVDKSKNVTQKAIVSRIKLIHEDGAESSSRPTHSKLYRPTESYDEVTLANQNIQDSVRREKLLEDRLLKVRGMISKHIGRSQTDMIRIFEDMKEELMRPYEVSQIDLEIENTALNRADRESSSEMIRILGENKELGDRLSDIESKLEDRERFCNSVQRKQGEDALEIAKLRQLIDLQNQDIADLEQALKETQSTKDQDQVVNSLKSFYETQLSEQNMKSEEEKKEMKIFYETKMREFEDSFLEERTKIRQQIKEVSENEINLLERIKGLESEKGYARAEVDRIVVKDADNFAYKQELEYIPSEPPSAFYTASFILLPFTVTPPPSCLYAINSRPRL
ncbi:sarcolemmal membrane-associated protein [Eurytemora carolleeae]|uniref:sarcolemmal membrane-associated protein n=1 Tax=Eurytemora carolleeae TaxID=1294199 RepID=UPI000C764B88|nr:sarcolemmal membrane-associated protein [Eurytemora carolleeae]|eukprot:XP_023336582.1 sarcolemmal membrane-associated protein-like [Eurytemora affinis]